MKDKCICYILVLSLIFNDYKLSLDELTKDLKITIQKLAGMSRVIFLTVGKDKKTVTLELPLPTSNVSIFSKKRKR